MRVRLLAVISAVSTLAGAVAAQAAAWDDERSRKVQAALENFLQPKGSAPIRPPSVSVAIGKDGKLLHAGGAGSAGLGRLATADTVYRIGSITKQFTAAAVLRMIGDGALAPRTQKPLTLDTEIGDIFADAEHWRADGQNPITLRSLLNMTSNLPNFTRRPPDDVDPWGTVEAATLLRELKKQRPTGWPGTFEYSNTSYFILAEVLEAARWRDGAAHPYEAVLQTQLFQPLGMTSTDFTGYRMDRMAIPAYHRRAAFSDRDWLKGSGDAASTVKDMFAWNSGLMAGKVLPEALRREMFREGGRVTPTIFYGMGWFMEDSDSRKRYFHSGSVPGFTSYNCIAVAQDGASWTSVTLLTNADGVEGLEDLASDLLFLTSAD